MNYLSLIRKIKTVKKTAKDHEWLRLSQMQLARGAGDQLHEKN